MGATLQFNITLPKDLAALIVSKVEASVSDVVADGVRAFRVHDAELERWLRDEVTRGHAENLGDPSRAVPAEELLDRIKARRRRSAPPAKTTCSRGYA